MIHGQGFRNEIDGEERDFGFCTTRSVDAESPERAGHRAISILRQEGKFQCISWSLATERVDVEEMEEVSWWRRRFVRARGFTFYMADESPDEES